METPTITNEFKQKFNELMVEINQRQDNSGKFRLVHVFDNSLYGVIEKLIAACEQYKADQGKEISSTEFMDLCKVEYQK